MGNFVCALPRFNADFGHYRIDRETPNFTALMLVAPGVRFRAFAIFPTPAFDRAIVFNVFTSSFDHARRTDLFVFLANNLLRIIWASAACSTTRGAHSLQSL
jgi:hypothetical protein